MSIAERQGRLSSGRTRFIRARIPEALVTSAKRRTGLNSDTELLQVALANLAVEDDYVDWILSRRGSVSREFDLDF